MAVGGLFLAVALLVPDCDHPRPIAGRPGLWLLYQWPSPPMEAPFRVPAGACLPTLRLCREGKDPGSLPTFSWAASVLGAPRPFVLGSVTLAGALLPTFICPVFTE